MNFIYFLAFKLIVWKPPSLLVYNLNQDLMGVTKMNVRSRDLGEASIWPIMPFDLTSRLITNYLLKPRGPSVFDDVFSLYANMHVIIYISPFEKRESECEFSNELVQLAEWGVNWLAETTWNWNCFIKCFTKLFMPICFFSLSFLLIDRKVHTSWNYVFLFVWFFSSLFCCCGAH